MKRNLQGHYVTISTAGEKARAFAPAPLPPDPPIDWTPALRSKFDQALLALGFAHKQGVTHRDITPANILLTPAGAVKLTDFGLAKQASASDSVTRTGSILGTPAYMAPEQAAGDRGSVGPTSDVYSLGSILYHMLTGRPPFQTASPDRKSTRLNSSHIPLSRMPSCA